ncbi:WD40-repeat-containing domain protein, partial [Gorgonomyces haynaldii]
VEFSPFFPDLFACASCANYGIVGNGKLWVWRNNMLDRTFDTQDGLFDLTWSEQHEHHLATSSGDGSIKLWDVTLQQHPTKHWHEHAREVFSVDWNLVRKDQFVSGSWDNTIKLWRPEANQSLMTFQEHKGCVYQTIWSPHLADVFASASGDHSVKVWDCRQPQSVQSFVAHNNEVLALDWNKYKRDCIVTGSVDNTIKVWDLKFPGKPLNVLPGHEYAVRRLKCSPHAGNLIASVSYDMSLRLWNLDNPFQPRIYNDHTEFVFGVDFSLFHPGQIATCSWDESVDVFVL